MTIEVIKPEMKDLIEPTAELEQLARGFLFTEGPVWDYEKRCLYFSDIPADNMYRYSEATGAEVYRKPSNYSNGFSILRNRTGDQGLHPLNYKSGFFYFLPVFPSGSTGFIMFIL